MSDTTYSAQDKAFTHLPADVAKALADYDARADSGVTTWDAHGFASEPQDRQGGWIDANLRAHLSVFDA